MSYIWNCIRSKYCVCGLVIDAVNHINDENNALENMSKYICMEENTTVTFYDFRQIITVLHAKLIECYSYVRFEF